jgi:hypothetical protein
MMHRMPDFATLDGVSVNVTWLAAVLTGMGAEVRLQSIAIITLEALMTA